MEPDLKYANVVTLDDESVLYFDRIESSRRKLLKLEPSKLLQASLMLDTKVLWGENDSFDLDRLSLYKPLAEGSQTRTLCRLVAFEEVELVLLPVGKTEEVVVYAGKIAHYNKR